MGVRWSQIRSKYDIDEAADHVTAACLHWCSGALPDSIGGVHASLATRINCTEPGLNIRALSTLQEEIMFGVAAAAATGGLTIFGFYVGIPLIVAFLIGCYVGKKWL
jgi:hypothetical protein